MLSSGLRDESGTLSHTTSGVIPPRPICAGAARCGSQIRELDWAEPVAEPALVFAAVDTAAQLECILGPGWQAYTTMQVEERARELELAMNFAWARS